MGQGKKKSEEGKTERIRGTVETSGGFAYVAVTYLEKGRAQTGVLIGGE